MVHRPSDSRILTNLLSHEKDYTKHFSSLLDTSHASLASISAYASASSPPISTTVLAVAGSFAGVDEALGRYLGAVEEWRNMLVALKDMEDEVGNIMRDREIYVNRLIKASKSQKPTRESLLVSQLPSSASTLSLKSEFSLTGKLSTAQAELQACEAHLAAKERELDAMRLGTVREGLSLRCKALVECGWAWGEMGKEGLRALEALSDVPSQPPPPPPSSSHANLIQDTNQPHSDLSLAPSQSASQTAPDVTPKLSIPPAHAIKDLPFPAHVLSRRITEEDLGPGSSDDEGATTHVQIVENPRFAHQRRRKSGSDQDLNRRYSIRQEHQPGIIDTTAKSDVGTGTRERRGSNAGAGFFGSIRGMFGKKNGEESDSPRKSKWKSRTNRNLKTVKHDSEDEGGSSPQFANPAAPMFAVPPSLSKPPSPAVRKLRRANTGSKKREPAPPVTLTSALEQPEPGIKRAEAWVNGQSKLNGEETKLGEEEKAEEPPTTSTTLARKHSRRASQTSETKERPKSLVKHAHGKLVTSASSPNTAQGATTTMLTLSRQSSMRSSQSVPAAATPRRAASVNMGETREKSPFKTHQRAATMSWSGVEPTESLMSIVEGVAKQNREERDRSIGGTIKAPIGKSRKELEAEVMTPPSTSSTPKPVPTSPRPPKSPMGQVLTLTKAGATGAGGSGGAIAQASPKSNPSSPGLGLLSPTAPPPIFTQMTLPKAPNPLHISDLESTTLHQPVPRKPSPRGTLPLRSALKNPSRTPSPAVKSPLLPPAQFAPRAGGSMRDPSPGSSSSTLSPVKAPAPLSTSLFAGSDGVGLHAEEEAEDEDEGDDGASMSSYETGHEAFEGDSPVTPPKPPQKEKVPNGVNGQQSTRKSVRVSLKPTFSPTPPAIADNERYEWTTTKRNGNGRVRERDRDRRRSDEIEDMWQDSSEEDEEYSKARRMLSRLTGRSSKR